MTEKKEGRDVTAPQTQGQTTTNSIPQADGSRNMAPVRRLRIMKGLSANDMTATVQTLYPRFDRYLLSKAENPEDYGIELRADALTALYAAHGPELAPKRPRKARRTKPCRVYGRLTELDYEALQRVITALGYQTFQDWFSVTVRRTLAAARWNNEGGI